MNIESYNAKFLIENTLISLYTEYFNILSVTVMAFFALYGLITVFWKNSSLNIFRGRVFIQAFCVAAIFAFAFEVSVFNFQHYLKYTANGEFHITEMSPSDSTVLLTTDNTVTAKLRATYRAEKIVPKSPDAFVFPVADGDTVGLWTGVDSVIAISSILFENLNHKVSSIYIAPIFGNEEHLFALIEYIDKEGARGIWRTFYKGFPRDYYIPLQACGEISNIEILIFGEGALERISHIAINKSIPFYFSGLRLFVVSCLFFAIFLLVYKPLRAKVSRLLFEYKFDPANKSQNVVYAFVVTLVLLFTFICAFTSTSKFFRENYRTDWQYNVYLVDALLAGRTYLDAGMPEMLQLVERPYDLRWLDANNYPRGVWWHGDWAYYKGKFYCYFGIVPAILLYVPYKMITGDYLSNQAGIFIFMAVSVVLLALLWRHCVKKYMPDMRFAFYLLSFLCLFCASGLYVPLRFTRFYSIVSAGGFMFTLAGILLLLKSIENERPKNLHVFFSCLCFALAVGCRPNLALASILVPAILWKHRSFKLAAIILLPYTLVAIPLCYYNYIRFGSIFEFGAKYNMTNLNLAAQSLMHPFGKIINTFTASIFYLFSVNQYTFAFPYSESVPLNHKLSFTTKIFLDKGCGLINFPIVFCLYFVFKNIFAKVKQNSLYLPVLFLIVAAVTILANAWLIGHSGRYYLDFSIFIIFASIFGAYYWCGSRADCLSQEKNRLKVVYTLLAVSIFVGLMQFAGEVSNDPSPSDPVLHRYLKYSLGIMGWV